MAHKDKANRKEDLKKEETTAQCMLRLSLGDLYYPFLISRVQENICMFHFQVEATPNMTLSLKYQWAVNSPAIISMIKRAQNTTE